MTLVIRKGALLTHHDGETILPGEASPSWTSIGMSLSSMTVEESLIKVRKRQLHPAIQQALVTALVLTLSALAALAAKILIGPVAAALIFVLGITIAGALGGVIAALGASFVAFLFYNFFLTDPAFSFRLASSRDIAPLIIFNLCGLVAGVLAGRLKDHAKAARRSNLQLENLLELSRTLQAAVRQQDVVMAVAKAAYHIVGAKISIYRQTSDGLNPLDAPPHDPDRHALAERTLAADSPTREEDGRMSRCLKGSEGNLGVMIVEMSHSDKLDPTFVDALGNMIALALERATFSETIAESRASARAEELKTALLSSVSHDFRTPLTAISASASSLITYRDQLDASTSAGLLRSIVEECERLNRYTANLLEMSRLEAGGGLAGLQTLSVAEMVGAAIKRIRPRAGNRPIQRCGETDALVNANAALFELVLLNVLDNAIRYSTDGSSIIVTIDHVQDHCVVTIADEGIGIPPGDLERVFTRFHRVSRAEAAPRGSGLGLAIAKGFVEAVGGTIEARVPGVGNAGTQIVISLPAIPEDGQ
ncbi:ATP-binding protein [Sphingomonas sp. MG17]|uniref:histidine kinase n=1 Tax=Sphingomonas tagetis TaxID=2949092 RepID=A0A9X2HTF5_9SPHN|nr:ATP-binding protein [Sphingomonas tagetis]MCP3733189.1 ATP-binding protein [Sphingomonas tagetis]